MGGSGLMEQVVQHIVNAEFLGGWCPRSNHCWAGFCSCGWFGKVWGSYDDAIEEARAHRDGRQSKVWQCPRHSIYADF